MVRRRRSGFEELIGVAARFPWWVGVILALVVYLGLHHVATMEIAKPQGLKGLGAFEGQTLYKTLAIFGQYIFSLAFLAGAAISAATSLRRAAANTGTTREVATVSTRVEPKLTGLGLNLDNHSSKRDSASSSLKPQVWSLDLLSTIEWRRFEDLAAEYYREKGIRCETTSLGADGGIDLKLFQDDSGKPTTIVQCKAWVGRMVGVKPDPTGIPGSLAMRIDRRARALPFRPRQGGLRLSTGDIPRRRQTSLAVLTSAYPASFLVIPAYDGI